MDGGRDDDPGRPGAGTEREGGPPAAADAGSGTAPEAATPPPASRRGGRRLRGVVSLVAFAGAAFLTGLLVFNYLVMPRLIHGGGEVSVPDLAGLTYEQAEQTVRSLEMQLSRSGERFDPSVPTGRVLSQDPPAGTPARGAQRIQVVLSLGEEYASVPELYGESLRGARLLIERAGLQIGGMTHAPSEDVGEGLVAASDPPAESVLPRGTPVGLLVSTGPGTETFVMPDVLGREIGSARRQLEALGFRVLVPPSGGIVGAVVFQDPGAGARITRDVTITLQATGRIIR